MDEARRDISAAHEAPVLSPEGLRLPAWAVALVAAAVVGVVTLAVESRLRLGYHDAAITRIEAQLEESNREHARMVDDLRMTLGKVQLSLARICQQVNAQCPQ